MSFFACASVMDAQDPVDTAEPIATVTRTDEKKKEEVVRKAERKDESERFEHTQSTETTTLWKNLMNYVLGNQLKAQQQQHPNTHHTTTRRRGIYNYHKFSLGINVFISVQDLRR